MREPSTLDHKPNVRAVISLVFGILGLVILPIVAPIVALATGYGVRNNELALAGVILGWIGLGIGVFEVVAAFSVFGNESADLLRAVPAELVQPLAPR